MRGHVDAESLALYAEGELSRGRTARVRAHLSGCPDCATTLAALADVTTQLSHVPAPTMPAAVTARLDAALNAEAAHRAAAPSAPAPAGPPPRRNPRWSPTGLRILAGTAVTLVVAGGVGYTLSQVSGSSSGSSGTASSAAPAPKHRTVKGAPFLSPGGVEKPAASSPGGPAYAQTGTDYQRGTLAAQAERQLVLYTTSGISGPHRLALANVPVQVSQLRPPVRAQPPAAARGPGPLPGAPGHRDRARQTRHGHRGQPLLHAAALRTVAVTSGPTTR